MVSWGELTSVVSPLTRNGWDPARLSLLVKYRVARPLLPAYEIFVVFTRYATQARNEKRRPCGGHDRRGFRYRGM
jgi:hypothetical protein